jgi:hypothetical protein
MLSYLLGDPRHRTLPDTQAPRWLVVAVLTLLAYGCPVQAIVAAFDLDENAPSPAGKESPVLSAGESTSISLEAGRVTLLQVQADEIRVKAVGGIFWLACALEVRSRLWLGGVISRHRDGELVRRLLIRVRGCGPVGSILLVTDGFASYKSQALKLFRFSESRFAPARMAVRGWCSLEG